MVFLAVVLALLVGQQASFQAVDPRHIIQDILMDLKGPLRKCDALLYPGLQYAEELSLFWYPEVQLKDNHLGCLFLCALYDLTLVHEDGPLDDYNMRLFFLSKNPDEQTLNKLIKIMHKCYKPTGDPEKTCDDGHAFLMCLRKIMLTPEWNPKSIYPIH